MNERGNVFKHFSWYFFLVYCLKTETAWKVFGQEKLRIWTLFTECGSALNIIKSKKLPRDMKYLNCKKTETKVGFYMPPLHKKWRFPLRISSANFLIKSAGNVLCSAPCSIAKLMKKWCSVFITKWCYINLHLDIFITLILATKFAVQTGCFWVALLNTSTQWKNTCSKSTI